MLSNSMAMNPTPVTVALAGQPNTGKSTLFNRLTGARQHVGNWPGKTVEQKSGRFDHNGITYKIVDLPGTYSLSANSQEEVIARDFIINGNCDLIVVVLDASQLERSLYMAAEVMALGVPAVLALNMMDVATRNQIRIDVKQLEKSLGVKIIPTTAARNKGMEDLICAIETLSKSDSNPGFAGVAFDAPDLLVFEKLRSRIKNLVPKPYKAEWVALKLMENDREIAGMMKTHIGFDQWQSLERDLPRQGQGLLTIANARYRWIKTLLNDYVQYPGKDRVQDVQGRFDRLATHPVWGGFLGIATILIGFYVATRVSYVGFFGLLPLVDVVNRMVETLFSDPSMQALVAMITQGIVPGMFMVFGMSSFIFGMLLVIGFLEDIGYLPRMACVADSFMNRIGLHGKSFLPLFMGLVCNIASIMGGRVIDSTRQRLRTLVLSWLIPCSGLMVTIAFMIGIFFGPVAPIVIAAIAAAIILQLVLTSFLLGHTVLPQGGNGMIMELPPYHKPNWRTIWDYIWMHYKAFLKKGGTLIMCIILVVWALSYYPNGNINESYLALAGKALEPLGGLMGMDWRLLTCLGVAFFSKEAAISSMAVIYGLNTAQGSLLGVMMENITHGRVVSNTVLGGVLADSISRPSAIAFIFAILFSVPCFTTIGVFYSETKSLKWTLGSAAYYALVSFLWGVIAFHVGLLLF